MLIEKIDQESLDFMELWHTPQALVECLFSDFDNLASFKDEAKLSEVRTYQLPMLSYESIIDEDIPGLSIREKFELRKNVGEIYNFGSRRYGKSLITLKIDMPLSLLHDDGWWVGCSSLDSIHLNGILDSVREAIENHPIIKCWKISCQKSPEWHITGKNGWRLDGINMNLNCFDGETEVFTNRGWLTYDKITKEDKVLSLDMDTNVADYYPIKNIFIYDYNGKSYRFKGGHIDFSFTPNHKILYNWSFKQNWQLKEVSHLNPKSRSSIFLKHDFIWKGKETDFPTVFEVQNSKHIWRDLIISADDWLEFLGWFVAEGHITHNSIYITQYESVHLEYFNEIKNLLKKLGVTFCICSNRRNFKITAKDIADYLKKHCYNSDSFFNSLTKKVPDYIKELTPRQINVFLSSYIKGDGTKSNNTGSTVSKQLADDIQELYLKIGKASSINKTNCQRDNTLYTISQLKSKCRNLILHSGLKIEDYNGKMWCVETEPHNLLFIRKNGKCIWTGNSKSPGKNFYSKHLQKLFIEEASFESQAIYDIRRDAVSELGCIFRSSGMTNFTKTSPTGKTFFDPSNRNKIINLPQMVNPFWSQKEKQDRLKEFGGESSINWRVFVLGEIIEDGMSEFDLERIQKCYQPNKEIKRFEITKERFKNFTNFIVVERPKNCERLWIASDIGESAGTDIAILSEVEGKYYYIYNIILYSLTKDEQEKVFKWLINTLNANVIGIDCGDALGRTLADDLEKEYGKDKIVRYQGAVKLNVGIETDENGNRVSKNGEICYKKEYMSEWSVDRLKHLFYEQKLELPIDHKLQIQLSSVISTQSGTRKVYECISEQDHLFSAFRVFAIAEWLKKSFTETPKMNTQLGIGASSWKK